MSMISSDFGPLEYGKGLTKQSFKNSCDINQIIKRAQKQGTLSHLQKYPSMVYGEFEGIDLLEAHRRVTRAKEIFRDLPSEVKNEFNQDPFAFAGFCANPANNSRLAELLPAIARPGEFYPNPVRRTDVPTEADIVAAHKRGNVEERGERGAPEAPPEPPGAP